MKNIRVFRSRLSLIALLALLVHGVAENPSVLAQSSNDNPGVVPANEKYLGLTYGEWQARFWQALFEIPVVNGIHPFLTYGAFGGKDGVVFLSPSYYYPGVSCLVEVKIPAGTPLFMPVRYNVECSQLEDPPFHGDDEASLRKAASDWIKKYASDYYAFIDGRPVTNINTYNINSPEFEVGPLPENNFLEFFGAKDTVGKTALAAAAGCHLLLTPLEVREHEVVVGCTGYDGNPAGGRVETVFHITVEAITPRLSITRSGGNVIVSWLGSSGTLESTTELKPTNTVWTSLGTQNPTTIVIESGQARYFRVNQ